MASKGWQHPYVNIFKHVKVENWKKSAKVGDVSSHMDKTLKCPVFWIKGVSPTNSYILLPKNTNHSLELTGRYFYLLFRPSPGKYFVVHLDVAVEEGRVVRISFSNMFKEFKSTPIWLQFPFLCGAAKDSAFDSTSRTAKHGVVGPAPSSVRWTCLMMDLQFTLSVYLNRHYSHLKSIKLCANMAVKNMFTTDLLLDPGVSFSQAKQRGLSSSQGTGPMPREMSFPVPRGGSWNDLYDYIKFPSEDTKLPFDSIQKDDPRPAARSASCVLSPLSEESHCVTISKPGPDYSSSQQVTNPEPFPGNKAPVVSSLPDLGASSANQKYRLFHDNVHLQGSLPSSSHPLTSSPPCVTEDGGIHVYVHPEDDLGSQGEESEEEVVICPVPHPVSVSLSKNIKQQKLLPDPILKLRRIIGFGGATSRHALWTKSGDAVVYPCHAIIVSMKISSSEQRFFVGHTDKISALAFNGRTTLLASAQIGNNSLVRLWSYSEGNCVTMFRSHSHSLSCLSFSYSGSILCGVGKDSHNKTMVVVWNTLNVSKGGEVTVLAKAHTEVDIGTMKVAFFDDTRMVSCGRDNIRLWRVRNGTLRSCPVNLGEYHSLDFSDVAFEEGSPSDKYYDDRTLFASTRSGHIFEIDYSRVVIKNVRKLLPAQQQHAERREKLTFNTGPGIPINSISVSSSFCATGSEDGFLRLWSLDFSAVLLEAEHEGPVSEVLVSSDSLQVLAATSTGNLGFLYVRSRGYNTLMRSHTDAVLGFSVDGIRRHLTTASSDGTVRVWSLDSLHQLYDFVSDDSPCCVAFHPHEQTFSCGFSSGIVRVFDIASSKLLAEHRHHRGEVIGLVFSSDGEYMYSADSEGSLALYNASEEDHTVIRFACNVVARGSERSPDALTVSRDSCCLAFVGPSEYIITIADAWSLDELLHVDVSILDAESSQLDSALKVCFSPVFTEHLLIATSANKVLWVSTKTGRLLREASKVHKHLCSSLAVSEDGRFLLTAGHNAIKVWDYNMQYHHNSQMYIGHSRPIHQLSFTPDQLGVISVGDAIFIWDFLGNPADQSANNCSLLNLSNAYSLKAGEVKEVQLSNGIPRQTAPLPSSQPQLDVSPLDHVVQSGLGCLSVSEDVPTNPTIPGHGSSPGPAADPRSAVSVLKVTVLENPSSLNPKHAESIELNENSPERPDCYKHFIPRFKTSSIYQSIATPQPPAEGMKLKAVIGYNGNGRGNMVWSPDQGLFAYSCGCVVVVEYLHTGSQRLLQGHSEEISCLALTNDGQTMTSAASSSSGGRSLIYIWDVQSGARRSIISYHKGAVQSLAFSRDDLLFLSVGDFTDPGLALWSSKDFQLVCSVSMSGPIHDAAFSPSAASHMACVGSQGVHFCLIQSQGHNVDLNVKSVAAPAEVGDVELTALCYHMDSFLFTSTNKGQVCAWDITTLSCLMVWEADDGEIGVLLCRGNRLLTGSKAHRLRLWDVEALQGSETKGNICSVDRGTKMVVEQELTLDGMLVSAAFDISMEMGIVGTTAGTLWYINWSDNSNIRLVSGHQNKVNDVVFSFDESHFATCSEDGSVRVWLTSSYELVVQFQVLNQACGCVCWSPSSKNSSCLAAGYSDGTVRIFRLASTEMERKLHPLHVAVTAIQYSASGDVIISAGENGLVAVSSSLDGATVHVIRDHKGSIVSSIQCVNKQVSRWSQDKTGGGETWLAVSADRRVSVWASDWSKEKCELLDWLSFPAPANFKGDSLPPSLAAFYPADPSVVVYTGYGAEKELSFYSLTKKQIVKKISLPHWATCMSLSSKNQLLAVGSKERVLKLIRTDSGRFQDFSLHSDSLQTCHFSPTGTLLFSVAFDEVMLWEVHSL
ncbi:WD repeat-containing protein 90 isoform X2 [Nothobranchius furzeri]|uniref:Transcript variant X2 n=1 Tax=Nothobranchius furzeri TaxID=105023 RepID=A0A1A7ZGW6_NOTFU|nr:transcript variant X2 [Nothobranchius furzeri]